MTTEIYYFHSMSCVCGQCLSEDALACMSINARICYLTAEGRTKS